MALVIAALGLGALMAAASEGLGNVGAADRYVEATRRAQSRLAMVGAAPLAAGDSAGDDGDGFSWRVQIAPIAMETPATAAPGGAAPQRAAPANGPTGNAGPAQGNLTLYGIGVTIWWRAGATAKSVSLHGERLAQAAGG